MRRDGSAAFSQHLRKHAQRRRAGKRTGPSLRSLVKHGRIAGSPLAKYVPKDVAAEPESLAVPLPIERQPRSTCASRDGQQEFRAIIIRAYGRCAVTGCLVEDVLDAAHIIPYAGPASNIVSNGLCLRTDIHRLYDANLIRIGADGIVQIDRSLAGSGYEGLQGRKIMMPRAPKDQPDPQLLAVRHQHT